MRDNKVNYTPSLTFLDILCVAFIVLKLTHVINWSWWIVLAPIWGGILFIFVAVFVIRYLTR